MQLLALMLLIREECRILTGISSKTSVHDYVDAAIEGGVKDCNWHFRVNISP